MKKRQEQVIRILEQLIKDGQLLVWVGDDGRSCSKEATILSIYAVEEGKVCIDLQNPFIKD